MDKNYTIKDEGKGKFSLEITIPADVFAKSYDELLKTESKQLDIKGFRKGQVPPSAVEPALKGSLVEETAAKIVPVYLLQALIAEKINIAIPPVYKEVPVALLGADYKFTVEVYSIPDFKIADISKIKVKKESKEATDEEQKIGLKGIKDVIKENKVDIKSKPDTDEWAAEVAKFYKVDSIKTMADIRKFVKEEIEKKKSQIVEQKFNSDLLTEAVKQSKIIVHPEIISFEISNREQSLIERLKKINKTLADWLAENKMTHEELHKALEEDSKQAIEQEVLLSKYANEKKIEINEKEFESFKQIIKQGQQINETEEWINNVKNVYIKQKAFEMMIKEVGSDL